MMGLDEIIRMNKEAEERAVRESVKLFRAKRDRDPNVKSAPFIGDHRPKGWRLVKKYFVDSSGFGAENEPALTFNQFVSNVKLGYGYAIIEQGQFQVYIGEFRKVVK